MRHLIPLLIVLACSGCARQIGDNFYEIFRFGMSSSEVRAAGTALYEDAFRDYDRAVKEEKIDVSYLRSNFEVIPAWIPIKPDGILTYFVFKENALKEMSLDYYFLPHAAPPFPTEFECNEKFSHIRDNIEKAYGKPTKTENTSDRVGRTTILTWLADDHTIQATKLIDDLGTGGPRCGVLHVMAFGGTEAESEKFDSELSKFAESQSKDARNKRAGSGGQK